jgi:hypothetical protein
MGLALRILLLDEIDSLHWLPTTAFEQMLQNPVSHRFSRFAGARVRMASVLVELVNRKPTRVVRATFSVLTFDTQGCLVPSAFDQHQRALAESALAKVLPKRGGPPNIIDAGSRFIAQGGNWVPSKAVMGRIEQTVLGRLKCARLDTSIDRQSQVSQSSPHRP